MFGKNFFDGLTGLFNDAEKAAKKPNAAFLAEIAPYCDSLGILVPKVPDIPYFVEKIVTSLGKELLNLNSEKSGGPLSESLIEDIKTKAFALHQIAGIMEKHGKITPESCVEYRRDTFLNAVSTIDAIQAIEAPINYAGGIWDRVKEEVRETVQEPLKDEARKLVNDELKQRFKATEEQKQEEDPVESKGIQDTLAAAASYVKAGLAAKDLKKALTPGGGYDYEQQDAYVATINQYMAAKEKYQRLKVASRALYVEDAEKNLKERVDKVAMGELGGGFMDKASSFFNDFMIKAHTVLDFNPELQKIQQKLKVKEAVINQQLDQLSKNDASFNINDLNNHKEIVNNQRPIDINEELESLLYDAKIEGNQDEELYETLNKELQKAKLLEAKCNLLDEKIDEATQNLNTLKANVGDYIAARKEAWFTDFFNEIFEEYFPVAEEKKRATKIPAAENLREEIQSGINKYRGTVQEKALAEGSLGDKAKEFKKYKGRFATDIEQIKKGTDPGEPSPIKIK